MVTLLLCIALGLQPASPHDPEGGPATAPATRASTLPKPVVDEATGVRSYSDIPYLEGEEADPQKHRLDLYLPADDAWREGRPILIWIHGGGWTMGDKGDAFGLYSRYCRLLAERGVAAANVSYRLTPAVRHPGHVEDVAAATAWIVRHASEFGYDPSALFVSGHSAGGHLAALLAADPRWLAQHDLPAGTIAGAIPSSGVFDVGPLVEASRRWQRVFPEAEAVDASPVTHIDPTDPPFAFIVEENGAFMRSQTIAMAEALRNAGVEPEIVQLANVNHITMLSDLLYRDGRHITTALRFIDQVLADRRETPDASDAPGEEPSAPSETP